MSRPTCCAADSITREQKGLRVKSDSLPTNTGCDLELAAEGLHVATQRREAHVLPALGFGNLALALIDKNCDILLGLAGQLAEPAEIQLKQLLLGSAADARLSRRYQRMADVAASGATGGILASDHPDEGRPGWEPCRKHVFLGCDPRHHDAELLSPNVTFVI